jgi:hypothetical protein
MPSEIADFRITLEPKERCDFWPKAAVAAV